MKEYLQTYDTLCSDAQPSSLSRATIESLCHSLDRPAWIAHRRSVFYNANGKLGLATRNAEIGDKVAMLHGSRMPLMLRLTKNQASTDL